MLFGGGTGANANGFGMIGKGLGFADGGFVSGPGSSRSDSVPAMLSNGEFVINASAAARFGPLLSAINSGKVGRFADGGLVGARSIGSSALGGPAIHAPISITVEGGSRGP